jgi:hypothetical protein
LLFQENWKEKESIAFLLLLNYLSTRYLHMFLPLFTLERRNNLFDNCLGLFLWQASVAINKYQSKTTSLQVKQELQ